VTAAVKTLQRRDPRGYPDWTLPVSVVAQIIESLKVDLAAQTLANVKVDVVAQSLPQLNVNIAAQTVDINVKTSSGANIVIDKLTQAAFTERTVLLTNRGTTPTTMLDNYTYRRGKFYPRGCRGFIRTVSIYCNNDDTTSHTFTIKISPQPGMGPIITKTLTVLAASGWAWRHVPVNIFWNYDSMFIWVRSDSDDYGGLAYDTGEPHDYYRSTDEVTWVHVAYRYWFEVTLDGATVGDLPVSGTINNVEVPRASAHMTMGTQTNVPPNTAVTLVDVYGAGFCDFIFTYVYAATGSEAVMFTVYCDGVAAFDWSAGGLNYWGFTASTPGISLLKYSSGGDVATLTTKRFEFTRNFRVVATTPIAGGPFTLQGRAIVNLIK